MILANIPKIFKKLQNEQYIQHHKKKNKNFIKSYKNSPQKVVGNQYEFFKIVPEDSSRFPYCSYLSKVLKNPIFDTAV